MLGHGRKLILGRSEVFLPSSRGSLWTPAVFEQGMCTAPTYTTQQHRAHRHFLWSQSSPPRALPHPRGHQALTSLRPSSPWPPLTHFQCPGTPCGPHGPLAHFCGSPVLHRVAGWPGSAPPCVFTTTCLLSSTHGPRAVTVTAARRRGEELLRACVHRGDRAPGLSPPGCVAGSELLVVT